MTAEIYSTIPGVIGPETEATLFAEQWTERFGGTWTIGARLRIHLLKVVTSLERTASGSLRVAEYSDLKFIDKWVADFIQHISIIGGKPKDLALRLIRDRSLYLWEDVEPRSMVAAVGETDHGIRVGYVYTPPAFRGRGYATAAVAQLSQLLLEGGRRFCCLYTDLANPTSNAIYARLGYRSLCDFVDLNISE